MKKERYAGFWIVITVLALLLLLGVVLLVMGIRLGPNRAFASPPVSL